MGITGKEKKEEPCSDSIMRTGQMEHITGRCSGVLWRRRLDGSRSAYADDTEYCGSLLCRSRFFELKTVQIMDGEELAACINRPCIKADDEGYNCEWSTELTVPQAMEEYIKAWFLLKVIAREFGLGDMNGFQFNVSVGYDLAGIQSPKVDTFLNSMKHAEDTEIFKHCKAYLLEHADWFEHVTTEDIEQIPPEICNSVTLSTLHGCPPQEIERIAMYLLTEKGFHTFVKCNPTLLGYEFARKTMDEMDMITYSLETSTLRMTCSMKMQFRC